MGKGCGWGEKPGAIHRVIPAKAGISARRLNRDSRLRGNDTVVLEMTVPERETIVFRSF
jgi:hypothetical protein